MHGHRLAVCESENLLSFLKKRYSDVESFCISFVKMHFMHLEKAGKNGRSTSFNG